MKIHKILTVIAFLAVTVFPAKAGNGNPDIETGADRTEEYIPLLKGKKTAVLSNQTGILRNGTHVLDTLLGSGIDVVCIMSPEHGFRGEADAGEHVSSSVDSKTGIPIKSLYDGDTGMPSEETMNSFDILVFDLQDVGVRYYTYATTMAKMMEACAKYGKRIIILDRPNPLGFYVDGPIMDMQYRSAVGWLPVPVVHGMTLGELARMINGEGWIEDGLRCPLTVIKCSNYTHSDKYVLPVKPSPNLPDMRSVYLYPSTCLFEGTIASLGRGTDKPFQMYGHPDMQGHHFSFTPESRPGAKNPPLLGRECFGTDLRTVPSDETVNREGFNLEYVIDAYRSTPAGEKGFFTPFFEKLAGQGYIREMIVEGKDAAQIRKMWKEDVRKFIKARRPYLLYPEK